MNTFTYIFLIALVLSYSVQFWLSRRQSAHVLKHRTEVPEAFTKSITLEAHQKAADYTIEKGKLGDIDSVVGIVFLLALTLGGGISLVFNYWASFELSPIMAGIASLGSVFAIMSVLELPTTLYQTFVIEEKYGFNNSTVKQFIIDQLMQLALIAIIGLPLLALILWVMDALGSSWWVWTWAILISFSLLMSWLYPTLIAPLFNKFTPLEDGTLKDRINQLLERCGFCSNGIFIMDGSKRSGHGNAYFTGMGSNKRIVFFDTLAESLDDDEMEAVLAHELGHFKRKHVIKMLVASSIMSLISLGILGWLITQNWFFTGLGVDIPSNAAALLLFMLVSPAFTTFMTPISAYFQRKFEFEADDFAAEHAQASKLISGLVKLYKENASTLTPDPLFSAFHYSHPPAAIRIAHLEPKL
ncbi:STE24 endopeptidase [Bathymodiolus platifrons methanotrophic gill symbiont]|uniref:M48 family metallopeptidase n=1 Tax=Bathymodiolus platifrons methanotrophic gill symbiont TaxID=113268 RepID=UPI000B4091ED|nr:M48 family metallopeptidase [Bathymodiolus platifrons methanotrophic gill symbiont]MCK5870534.1 M48 family metallopeptidase [Methyloprofundus sp.]TXK94784.1 peptidase M48 [Methylococcaceae bacterium CS4]TXK95530.1 peptidase M48 [Methylococcaceae bacterium CS5]TXL04339.1 peptidase M48 [Methylococcaceae bacterium CS3]TXL06247.1 peptidase M48 [Methylococcaceae bacterium CS1]TXL10255.1 peptidase M48 [Methylococcaceae bacterium CS2]TXL13278.1 peptidase M48 [Methylococcaceae bacterium HT4]TXL1